MNLLASSNVEKSSSTLLVRTARLSRTDCLKISNSRHRTSYVITDTATCAHPPSTHVFTVEKTCCFNLHFSVQGTGAGDRPVRIGGGTVGRSRGWRGRECGVQNIYIYREGVRRICGPLGWRKWTRLKQRQGRQNVGAAW